MIATPLREAVTRVLRAALVPGALVGFIAIAHCAQRPPAPVAASAPATTFSAERALRDLEVIAASPRPLGSARHAEVQRYLEQQLAASGVEPRVETSIARKQGDLARVSNVTARMRGSLPAGQAGTLALVAHYDSVPTGPGAGDNGANVAAMLETLRALKAGPPLRNDVVFLFTDGEELGLFGARQVDQTALDVVLNFEAREAAGRH